VQTALRAIPKLCLALFSLTLLLSASAGAGAPVHQGRVEVVLANQYRSELPTIQNEFRDAGFPNVHIQFTRTGQTPPNIGIGRNVPAESARAAMRLAIKYTGGLNVLLPVYLFPPTFITIASSNFDDTVEYRIDDAALRQLLDPSLDTEKFHALYRKLTVGK
jgi:hypothetical protein